MPLSVAAHIRVRSNMRSPVLSSKLDAEGNNFLFLEVAKLSRGELMAIEALAIPYICDFPIAQLH